MYVSIKMNALLMNNVLRMQYREITLKVIKSQLLKF